MLDWCDDQLAIWQVEEAIDIKGTDSGACFAD